MIIKNVFLDDENYLMNMEVNGSCNASEAASLEKLAKSKVYFLGIFGKKTVDTDGFHGSKSLLAEFKIKYALHENPIEKSLDFQFFYRGTRINWFLKSFQKKFGIISQEKQIYY
jgi:hypothetical protein